MFRFFGFVIFALVPLPLNDWAALISPFQFYKWRFGRKRQNRSLRLIYFRILSHILWEVLRNSMKVSVIRKNREQIISNDEASHLAFKDFESSTKFFLNSARIINKFIYLLHPSAFIKIGFLAKTLIWKPLLFEIFIAFVFYDHMKTAQTFRRFLLTMCSSAIHNKWLKYRRPRFPSFWDDGNIFMLFLICDGV